MEKQSFFDSEVHPLKQAGVFIVFNLIVLICVWASQRSNPELANSTLCLELSLSILLTFALFNSVMSLPYENQNDYWFNSTLAFIAVGVSGAFFSYLFKGTSVLESGIFKWMYFVFTFGYLVFLSIVRAMRKIVEIAQRQDARLRGEDDFQE